MKDPCIKVCRYDGDTGWCLGCGMGKADWKRWKSEKGSRHRVLAALPGRLATLSRAGLPTGKAAKRRDRD